ncbi:MAG TPA: hypothetical protein VN862_05210 [Candidatus Acidoferrales bacterium]|nr:hypothetical protein [Candidatus Acidoferrales bacterium]
MTTAYIIAAIALMLLILLAVILRAGSGGRVADPPSPDKVLKSSREELRPSHYRNLSVVLQALSEQDDLFLTSRVNPEIRKRARAARCAVALQFLEGLREDHRRLDRLARMLTALSHSVDRGREYRRWWVTARFELFCLLLSLKLRCGAAPIVQIRQATNLIGDLAVQLERAMHAWQDASLKSPAISA